MSKLVDYGDGLIAPAPAPLLPSRVLTIEEERARCAINGSDYIRSRAMGLEQKSKGKPVRVRMPSGHTFNAGGECLVQALANGAQPVELD
jgi:hypothetical protein